MKKKMKVVVRRHRLSVTQGEAEVIVNGRSLGNFADDYRIHGKYGMIVGFWGSIHPKEHYLKVLRHKKIRYIGSGLKRLVTEQEQYERLYRKMAAGAEATLTFDVAEPETEMRPIMPSKAS